MRSSVANKRVRCSRSVCTLQDNRQSENSRRLENSAYRRLGLVKTQQKLDGVRDLRVFVRAGEKPASYFLLGTTGVFAGTR